MIIPKVVAHNFQRFLEISSSLISNIVVVGTTNDNVSSKRKTLDEIYKHAYDKEIDTPNIEISKGLYEYKNINETKGNNTKRKSS